ncbi:O-antigen ligase family protein [Algoriphagus sp. H41]|uniref:O-antigen ligase family protein n=1 Tax=Algoriphagus oliviformis TaxID=2811231 RepID=A0ABS3BY47_9BACT|nr:O-antigen ligase family protein [Algoriphagus oliviformis]MBN7809336.1 O-antigen ligase family protein [Algoriphagus oliviformis]
MPEETTETKHALKSATLGECLFLLSLLSIFLPWKVYPAVFLASSLFFLYEARPLRPTSWMLALSVYIAYGLAVFGLTYTGQSLELSNAAKLAINPFFLICSVHWLSLRDNARLAYFLDWTLGALLLLSLVQLLVYHASFDFRLALGSDSSGQASSLYRPSLYFWGLDDKNMFGARIALLGFVFIFIPVLRAKKLSIARTLFVFLVAFLSLSRTPMVALLFGVSALGWLVLERKWRIVLLLALAVSLPVFLTQVIRIESITSSNDGMGIRLVYWTAFFSHFSDLSVWGGGFLEAERFLGENAKFYRGEPHIHNTFMTTYVEFGLIGFLAFLAFLGLFFRHCCRFRKEPSKGFESLEGLHLRPHWSLWLLLFLPIVSIMMILYSGYDNDIMVYLSLVWLVGTQREIAFHQTKIKVL